MHMRLLLNEAGGSVSCRPAALGAGAALSIDSLGATRSGETCTGVATAHARPR